MWNQTCNMWHHANMHTSAIREKARIAQGLKEDEALCSPSHSAKVASPTMLCLFWARAATSHRTPHPHPTTSYPAPSSVTASPSRLSSTPTPSLPKRGQARWRPSSAQRAWLLGRMQTMMSCYRDSKGLLETLRLNIAAGEGLEMGGLPSGSGMGLQGKEQEVQAATAHLVMR